VTNRDKGKGKARVATPKNEPGSVEDTRESSGTSDSEFVLSDEDEEDDTDDEEIMVDAAVRLSLQVPNTNGASTSSGRSSGPNADAVLRAVAAERRLARNKKALVRAIEEANEDYEEDQYGVAASDSDSQDVISSFDSESNEEPLAKKKANKSTVARSKVQVMTIADMRQHKNEAALVRRELKREQRALMAKLGRRLTYVWPDSQFF
jgi:DNA repair protein RAD16